MNATLKTFVSRDLLVAFEYREFADWAAVRHSDSTLRYLPSDRVRASFEVPPSVVLLPFARVRSEDLQLRAEEGTNPHGVRYRSVHLKGWEREGFLFEKGQRQTFALGVESHPELGLPGDEVAALLRDSFESVEPTNLSNAQVRAVLEASPHQLALAAAEAVSGTQLELVIARQADGYVVSLGGGRGGPVFHLAVQALHVTIIPTR